MNITNKNIEKILKEMDEIQSRDYSIISFSFNYQTYCYKLRDGNGTLMSIVMRKDRQTTYYNMIYGSEYEYNNLTRKELEDKIWEVLDIYGIYKSKIKYI